MSIRTHLFSGVISIIPVVFRACLQADSHDLEYQSTTEYSRELLQIQPVSLSCIALFDVEADYECQRDCNFEYDPKSDLQYQVCSSKHDSLNDLSTGSASFLVPVRLCSPCVVESARYFPCDCTHLKTIQACRAESEGAFTQQRIEDCSQTLSKYSN